MGRLEKVLRKILLGTVDKNFSFNELCWLLRKLGFEERTKGSHRIFFKTGIDEIINLQPKGKGAKPYQVKQVRKIIIEYDLGDSENE